MPIYEYVCQACGHRFDEIQKFSDAPLVNCPQCGKPDLEKLVSASAFHLKGKGWYATDFKDKGSKPKGDETPPCGRTDKTDGCEGCKDNKE